MDNEVRRPHGVAIDASGEPRRVDGTTFAPPRVIVYWRPGCPSCTRLLGGLARLGVTHDAVDIWRDSDSASFVRQVAHGNETVPTVIVGDRTLVNPSLDELVGALGAELGRSSRASRRGEVVVGVLVVLAILVSLAFEAAGHPGVSWTFSGVVVFIVAVLRPARRRRRRRR